MCVCALLTLSPIHFDMNIIIVIVYIICRLSCWWDFMGVVSHRKQNLSKLPVPLALKLFQLSPLKWSQSIFPHLPFFIHPIFNNFILVSPLFLHNTIFNFLFLGRYFRLLWFNMISTKLYVILATNFLDYHQRVVFQKKSFFGKILSQQGIPGCWKVSTFWKEPSKVNELWQSQTKHI